VNTNRPPQTQGESRETFPLSLSRWNANRGDLVRTFVHWSRTGIWAICSFLCKTEKK